MESLNINGNAQEEEKKNDSTQSALSNEQPQ